MSNISKVSCRHIFTMDLISAAYHSPYYTGHTTADEPPKIDENGEVSKAHVYQKVGFIHQVHVSKICRHRGRCNNNPLQRGFRWKTPHLVSAWFCEAHSRCIICGIPTHGRHNWGDNRYTTMCTGCIPPMCAITDCSKHGFTYIATIPVCKVHRYCSVKETGGAVCSNIAGVDITSRGERYSVCKNHLHNGEPLNPRCIVKIDNKRCVGISLYNTAGIDAKYHKLCDKHFKRRYNMSVLTLDPQVEQVVSMIGYMSALVDTIQTNRLGSLPQEVFDNIAIWLSDRDIGRLMMVSRGLYTLSRKYLVSMLSVVVSRYMDKDTWKKPLLPDRHVEMLHHMVYGDIKISSSGVLGYKPHDSIGE